METRAIACQSATALRRYWRYVQCQPVPLTNRPTGGSTGRSKSPRRDGGFRCADHLRATSRDPDRASPPRGAPPPGSRSIRPLGQSRLAWLAPSTTRLALSALRHRHSALTSEADGIPSVKRASSTCTRCRAKIGPETCVCDRPRDIQPPLPRRRILHGGETRATRPPHSHHSNPLRAPIACQCHSSPHPPLVCRRRASDRASAAGMVGSSGAK